jgi:hypothetical protein
MKKLLMFTFLATAGFTHGQTKNQVDQRLVENHGQEIYQILEYRKDYYKFLLFELDNAYEIVNISDLVSPMLLSVDNIQSVTGESFNIASVDESITFNFIRYNFIRQKEQNVYYDLGNGRAIKFTALKVLWQQFDDSGLNTKI